MNRRNKKNKRCNTVNHAFEDALAAQRLRHQQEQVLHDNESLIHQQSISCSSSTAPLLCTDDGIRPCALKGFVFDTISQRFYKHDNHYSHTSDSLALAIPRQQSSTLAPSSTPLASKRVTNNIVDVLRTQEKRLLNILKPSCTSAYRQLFLSRMTIAPLYSVEADQRTVHRRFYEMDDHPVFGLAVVQHIAPSTSTLCICGLRNQIDDYQSTPISPIYTPIYSCVDRITCIRWSPSTHTPLLAISIQKPTNSSCILILQPSNTILEFNTVVLQYFEYANTSIRCIEWSICGEYLYLSEENNRILKHTISHGCNKYIAYNIKSLCVSICNSKLHEHIKYLGLRSSSILCLDERINNRNIATHRYGKMKYCIDHMYCLSNDFSLIVSDITNCIKIFDIRKPSSTLLNIKSNTSSISSPKIRNRKFYVSNNNKELLCISDNDQFCEIRSLTDENTMTTTVSTLQNNMKLYSICPNWIGDLGANNMVSGNSITDSVHVKFILRDDGCADGISEILGEMRYK